MQDDPREAARFSRESMNPTRSSAAASGIANSRSAVRLEGENNACKSLSCLLRKIDLALIEAFDQFLRRQVNQSNVSQALEHRIRDGFADANFL
ncbi:hypothetical protein RLIN73S_03912 [Rhodanobacter lindaniclasticus]